MAALGSATLVSSVTMKVLTGGPIPASGALIDSGVILNKGSSTTTTVTPKRYLNVGGIATPIQ